MSDQQRDAAPDAAQLPDLAPTADAVGDADSAADGVKGGVLIGLLLPAVQKVTVASTTLWPPGPTSTADGSV
jgi:hypothetical protein